MAVPIEDVMPGSLSGEDVFNSRGDLLLGFGAVLTPRILEHLHRIGVNSLMVASSKEEGPVESPRAIPSALAAEAKKQVFMIHALGEERKVLSPLMIQNLEKIAQKTIEHIMASDEALFTKVKHIGNHDTYTCEHSWMVFLFTFGLIQRALNQGYICPPDPPGRNSIALGALLHDFGKTQIPLEILNKKEKLTWEEMEVLREHPQLGANLLRDYESINPFTRSIILHHHQRWDGQGYGPASGFLLKEEEIPRYIHLVSLADNFDALISDRPYRRGYQPNEARSILYEARGGLFNPRVVPFIDDLMVEYPIGSVVLLDNGAVVNVNGLPRKGVYQCYVVGSLSFEGSSLLGETLTLPRDKVVCAANSVKGLAECLAQGHYDSSFLQGRTLKIFASSPWHSLLHGTFKSWL